MRVLLVEDEKMIADLVCMGFSEQGIAYEHCANGIDGFSRASVGGFDVIVLDIMLPGCDGLSILKGLRNAGNLTPVMLLTARNELDDRIEGFTLGADDYLGKPFFVKELIARIQALARRVPGERQNMLCSGDLKLDRTSRKLTWCGEAVDLTRREFNLMEYLMCSPGCIFTRAQILMHVWNYDFNPSTNIIDVCILRIRKKMAAIGMSPECASAIESVRGVGYRFNDLT